MQSFRMPRGRLVTRSVTNTRPPNMTLNLECFEEPLSEAQVSYRAKVKENCDRVAAALDELVKEHGGKLICQAGTVNGYQYTIPANSVQTVKNVTPNVVNVGQNNNQPIKVNMVNNANTSQGNIQLVVNSRTGVILGQVSQQQGTSTTNTIPVTTTSSQSISSQPENYKYTRSGRRTKVLQVQQQPDIIEEPPPPSNRGRPKGTTTHVVTPTTTSPQGVTNLKIKTVSKQQSTGQTTTTTTTPIPAERTSIGGIAVGNKASIEQVDEASKNLPDGREVTFNKLNGGRTFPSLVVVARPNLQAKEIPAQVAQKERSELDTKVKSILMYSPTRFTEWLIQQGLVKAEQYCTIHSTNQQKTKFKLGMYSDLGTFPYSGGYVWVSKCCPDRYISVFSGSIFQGAPYTPTVLLKLIYHWACQTNVQNVVSWVKVPNVYVKHFYTNLRSVCTAALWDRKEKMGGKKSTIQIGVISLGTTSQDGNLRQVKVEVLGVLDLAKSDIRLCACDPIQNGDRSYKRRFSNILHPLKDWVHPASKIMTDFTVDKSTLQEMGFTDVVQCSFAEQKSKNFMSNYHIMEYLRNVVPRMFQNTLSLLNRSMIQQFLDELVWRETYGVTAARAFENICQHISEMTRLDTNEALIDRLSKIAANPYLNWSYSNKNGQTADQPVAAISSGIPAKQPPPPLPGVVKRGRKRTIAFKSSESEPKKIALDGRSNEQEGGIEAEPLAKTVEQVQLQEYYYASMPGDQFILVSERKSTLYFKCFLCATIMRTNTEVMEHMISHVPPQVPGQTKSPVCRYCCKAFSSEHQMVTHITESHSNFGHSDSDMVVCAICEQKFGNSNLLLSHLSSMHYPSEIPYRCESCGYRSSSHKDVIDHFYQTHERSDGLQCPYCLKVIKFLNEGNPNAASIHTFLLHMQRHIIRREQGRGNKCPRCCLWFNQKSWFKAHQRDLHSIVPFSKVTPYSGASNVIMIPKQKIQPRRVEVESPEPDMPRDERFRRWTTGPITVVNAPSNLSCLECEEDIDEQDHYPGEQRCSQCRYVTCCWRAYKEHQQQIHNERPLTSLIVPSPLINIPLEKMQCSCGYTSTDGNRLATHLVKCEKTSVCPVDDAPSGMLDSLGLVPKTLTEETTDKPNPQ